MPPLIGGNRGGPIPLTLACFRYDESLLLPKASLLVFVIGGWYAISVGRTIHILKKNTSSPQLGFLSFSIYYLPSHDTSFDCHKKKLHKMYNFAFTNLDCTYFHDYQFSYLCNSVVFPSTFCFFRNVERSLQSACIRNCIRMRSGNCKTQNRR